MVSCRDSLHQTQLLVKPGETAGRRRTLWLRKSRWGETEEPIGRSWGIPVAECIMCPFFSMALGSPCLPQSQIRLVVSHVWNVPPCLGWWYSLVNYIDIHVYFYITGIVYSMIPGGWYDYFLPKGHHRSVAQKRLAQVVASRFSVEVTRRPVWKV